uniref:Uncharacterized protein n=1 Tax=Mucochytrium quahogii TaxID=96639 RepID=A0A7S2WA68_9STRA|mmetsp:Transcript_17770/g.38895  ORF Transcript_17770/g.38895 Transcript_17770/m.38895 type:complete len:134 (+) Transcript_17770:358-759(+)
MRHVQEQSPSGSTNVCVDGDSKDDVASLDLKVSQLESQVRQAELKYQRLQRRIKSVDTELEVRKCILDKLEENVVVKLNGTSGKVKRILDLSKRLVEAIEDGNKFDVVVSNNKKKRRVLGKAMDVKGAKAALF